MKISFLYSLVSGGIILSSFTGLGSPITGESLDVGTADNFTQTSNLAEWSYDFGMIGQSIYLFDTRQTLVVGRDLALDSVRSSIVSGDLNVVSTSEFSLVSGYSNSVSGTFDSLVTGGFNSVGGGAGPVAASLVAGENNVVTPGVYKFVFGNGLVAGGGLVNVTVGKYNSFNAQHLFAVGNGTSTSRRNAFEVYQNGNVAIPGGSLTLLPSASSSSSIVLDPTTSTIRINGQPVLTSNVNGNVGLGTSNPQGKLHIAGDGYALFGPNSSWGQNLRVGGNGNVTLDASVAATDGNLHLDSAPSNATYLNYYKGTGGVNFGGGQGGATGIVGSVSAAGDLTMNGKSVLKNNVKIFGSSEGWAEGLTVIQSSGWGGIRLTRNDPATGNYEGNWAVGYTGWSGNDFSISNSTAGVQHDAIFHIASSTQNVGIGTGSPVSNLHISGSAKSNGNVGQSGNSNLTVEARETGRTPGAGAAIGFVVPGNTDGSNRWEQGRILVTPDNGNNGDANGRMYLQTRSYVPNAWVWRDNIILTSNGGVTIPKRQGDIVMGEFGNPNSGD